MNGMKNRTLRPIIAVFILLLVCIFLVAILFNSSDPGFFAQSDAYIAAESGEEIDIYLTYFENGGPTSEQLLGCSFPGAESIVKVTSIDIDETDSVPEGASCSVKISLSFIGSGECDVQYLVFEYPDTSRTYKIGEWHFDVDGLRETIEMDSNSSVYANAVDDMFPFRYFFEDELNPLDKVYIQYNETVEPIYLIPEAQEVSGKIHLPESEYPLRLIRPRVVVQFGGHEAVAYPVGLFQGGYLDFDADDYKMSRSLSRS